MKIKDIDTPALLIDEEILLKNIIDIQQYADEQGVKLRPHTKTHKMPYIAALQRQAGCAGIAVAKTGEAEIMAANGQNDIFIANEIVGDIKLKKIKKLAESIDISFGIDCAEHVQAVERVFEGADKKAQVLIEIEVGERRSGIITDKNLSSVLNALKKSKNINLKGFFSHDGNSYNVRDLNECRENFENSLKRTMDFVKKAEKEGFIIETVSIGSTPPILQKFDLLKGITELRIGTYTLMDASMSSVISTLDRCAATVLSTIISKPTEERVITDVGAKGITAQRRTKGITAVEGGGLLKAIPDVHIDEVFDEHAIFYSKKMHDTYKIGDKVEIIPVHICPVCNLYDEAYLIKNDEVIKKIPILCRGKLQ